MTVCEAQMTEEEVKNLYGYLEVIDADLSGKLKRKYTKEIAKIIKNPTLENVRSATGSFLLLYMLVSAEENKKSKD